MNHRSTTPADLLTFATICREVAKRYGDDWTAFEAHIKKQLDALPKDRRDRLATEVDRILRYRAPDANSRSQ